MKSKLCSPAVEIFTVNVRPYYLPREFPHVIVTTVYVPSSVIAREVADILSSHVYDLDTSAPDAVKLVSGISTIVTSKRRYPGMNSMSLVLHAVIVHWTCFIPTCTMRTGLCPCRHPIAPITVWSIFCPATGLSCSDSPSHKNCWRLVERLRKALMACFHCTDWSVIVESSSDVCELTDTVSDYIYFCEDCVILRKTVNARKHE